MSDVYGIGLSIICKARMKKPSNRQNARPLLAVSRCSSRTFLLSSGQRGLHLVFRSTAYTYRACVF